MTTYIQHVSWPTLVFVGLLSFSMAAADTEPESFAYDVVGAVKSVAFDDLLPINLASEYVESSADGLASGFPLATGLQPDPWTSKTFFDDYGFWGFASVAGRVRARIRSGTDHPPASTSALQRLLWSRTFVRDSGVDPTFTLNPSWLEVRANARGLGWLRRSQQFADIVLFETTNARATTALEEPPPPTPPFAAMDFTVALYSERQKVAILKHRSEVSGIAYDSQFPLELGVFDTQGKYDVNFPDWDDPDAVHPVDASSQLYYIEGPYCIDLFGVAGFSAECQQKKRDGIHFEIGPYTGRLDLDAVGVQPGETYQIVYLLNVEAGEDQREQFAEAYLADPLDAGVGGLTLDTADSTVAGPTQMCDETPDDERYIQNGDGTVTDRSTGLMWQRCPLGMALDDRGTTDPADDACTASPSAAVDWQGALQAAAADSAAGYLDWSIPDIKSLESLVSPGCILAAADRVAFPDTPFAAFWSSTPLRQDPTAWQVNFAYGDVSFEQFSEPALVRLVRDNGEAPQLLRPEIRIDAARVIEGAAGETSVLRFPVRLSRLIEEDVTVDWETRAESAAAGTDFEMASGTLAIPAGADLAYIDVTVFGDRDAEADEVMYVELSNASGNARLPYSAAAGSIEDDEPRLRASKAETVEGDAGSAEVVIKVYLDRPAAQTLSVDYVTADASATAGSDYAAQSGTLQFAAGVEAGEIRIAVFGDQEHENDERFEIELVNFNGLHVSQEVIEATIVDDDGPGTYAALNDTGITHCATGDDGFLACPQDGLPLQDGDVGRDVTDPNPDDGDVGFSFVKLDATGNELASAAFPWSCVRDEVTGLVWENKSFDMASPNYRYWTYSWRNDSGINDGGDAGVIDGGECLVAGTCDTQQFVNAMNATALCGFTDWRLPSVDELFSISDFNQNTLINSAGLDSNYFRPNPSNGDSANWSSTPAAGNPAGAWMVQVNRFGTRATDYGKGTPAYVRLVRGGVQ